jgi:hypothetical protein
MPPITAEEEFSRNNKLKRENIEYLRDWISKQPHLPSGVTGKTTQHREIRHRTVGMLTTAWSSAIVKCLFFGSIILVYFSAEDLRL